MNEDTRFWSKVAGGPVEECWLWQASINNTGYGRFSSQASNCGYVVAHRWAYEQMRAEIPAGLVLDHLCRTTTCVNPWHLEPVTRSVNALRGRLWESEKTHCSNGHPYAGTNLRLTREGHRVCRTCNSERCAIWRTQRLTP